MEFKPRSSDPVPGSNLEPRTSNLSLTVLGYPVRTTGPSYLPRSIEALQGLSRWKLEAPLDAPDLWLRLEIGSAFQQLVTLRLGQTPAVEMLPLTAEMWVNVVGEGMTEALDRERVKAGFKQLYRNLKWWPQQMDLLKAMPNRPSTPFGYAQGGPAGDRAARAERSRSQEADVDVSAGGEKLQDILDMLKQKEREGHHGTQTND